MRSGIPVFFVLLAAAAGAADPTPVPADSIAAAKADLAAIRSPLAQPDSGLALPSLDMKDVAPVAGAQLPDMPELLSKDSEIGPDGLKRKKEGTGNWLVDAMDKKTDRAGTARGREKDDILKGDLDLMRDEHTGAKLGKDGLPVEEEREKTAAEPVSPAYNPLDSFMSGWVSAKDHDLLLPATKPDGLTGEAPRVRTDALQSLELGPSASQTDTALPGVDVEALSDVKPAANPYLVDMDLGAPPQAKPFPGTEGTLFAPLDPIDAPRGVSTSGVDARPIDGPRSVIPDFAQPSDDDKYFKQLKKF